MLIAVINHGCHLLISRFLIYAHRSRCLTVFQSGMNVPGHIELLHMTLITNPAPCALPQVITTFAPRSETLAISRGIISRLDGAGTTVPVEEVADPETGRTAVIPPHGCDVDASRVARWVEAEAFGLVTVRTIVGDSGESVQPCCRGALELGTADVAVEVDLCSLTGLPLGHGGSCQVGGGHNKREEVRSDHGIGYL